MTDIEEPCLTVDEQKAQSARCPCHGSDDYCPCQNVSALREQQKETAKDHNAEIARLTKERDHLKTALERRGEIVFGREGIKP